MREATVGKNVSNGEASCFSTLLLACLCEYVSVCHQPFSQLYLSLLLHPLLASRSSAPVVTMHTNCLCLLSCATHITTYRIPRNLHSQACFESSNQLSGESWVFFSLFRSTGAYHRVKKEPNSRVLVLISFKALLRCIFLAFAKALCNTQKQTAKY